MLTDQSCNARPNMWWFTNRYASEQSRCSSDFCRRIRNIFELFVFVKKYTDRSGHLYSTSHRLSSNIRVRMITIIVLCEIDMTVLLLYTAILIDWAAKSSQLTKLVGMSVSWCHSRTGRWGPSGIQCPNSSIDSAWSSCPQMDLHYLKDATDWRLFVPPHATSPCTIWSYVLVHRHDSPL